MKRRRDPAKRRKPQLRAKTAPRLQAQIMDHVHDAIVVTDLEGLVTGWNAGAERMFGYSAKEALGKPVSFIYPEDQHQFLAEGIVAPLRQKGRHQAEARGRSKSGREFPIHLSLALVKDSKGVVVGMVGSSIDITERKRAEEALRESEERLRATNQQLQLVFQSSPLAIYTRDTHGLLTSWNPAAEKMFGWKEAEVLGKPLPTVPDEARAQSDGYRMRVLAGETFIKQEAQRRRRDGSPIDLDTFLGPLRDGAGNISGIITVAADITERKRVQRQLEDETEHHRMAQGMALMVSMDWNIGEDRIGWSRPPEWLLGPCPQTGSYPLFKDMVHLEDRQHFLAMRQAALEGSGEHQLEYRIVRTDGDMRWVSARGVVLRDAGGRALRMRVVLQDITERKRAVEVVSNYNRRLRDLSQRMIEAEDAVRRRINRELHDRVGANLSALSLGFSMLRSKLSPESLRATGVRPDDLQRLLDETITHIRDVMADLHPPALDDYGLLAALRVYAAAMSERFAVPVNVRGEELVPRLPLATETALFRVAQGALANALTHAHARRIEILLAASPEGAVLTIADDGIGFDVAQASLAHPSWGLAIMRERAEAAGGRLTVESAPRKGTRVCVEISRGGGRRNAG